MYHHTHISSAQRAALAIVVLLSSFASLLTRPVLARAEADAAGPAIALTHHVSREPLLGGGVGYAIHVRNTGTDYVLHRGFNLTVTDTLPLGVTYTGASPAPSAVMPQTDGRTVLVWDNIADLEAGEQTALTVNGTLSSSLTLGTQFTATASAQINTAPDNSGAWTISTADRMAVLQAVDIEATVIQSTAGSQASGAGEYGSSAPGRGAGADWPFVYRITVQNNAVVSSTNVIALIGLPPGVAYLGSPAITPNPNSAAVTPTLKLQEDGSLDLSWSLGSLQTSVYTAPVVITFNAAIPYRYRTAANTAAASGPFAGPMSGSVIPESAALGLDYEATGGHKAATVSDGSESTPDDDDIVSVSAKYLTLSKSATPGTVGIGTDVTFALNYYVSEYYTTTGVIISDTLPDGMTYVDGSASLAPAMVQVNTPSTGLSTLMWTLPAASTTPGRSGVITFHATVDDVYEADAIAGQSLAAADRLTNDAVINGNWQDDVQEPLTGVALPEDASATVHTRMPSFTKQVWDARTNSWTSGSRGYVGDTLRFKLTYASPADIGAKSIIIRDYLPRGMSFVASSDSYAVGGVYSDAAGCASAPSTPVISTLSGLQYIEWRLCNAAPGATWQVTLDARVNDSPSDVQPGWIVANFGKLSGQNTFGAPYSMREIATIDYVAPRLVLTKNAGPSTDLVVGRTVYYTITVQNAGAAPAYNVVLTDVLPLRLGVLGSGASGTPGAANYGVLAGDPVNGAGGTIGWTSVYSIAAGATQTYYYRAEVRSGYAPGEQLTNLASVAYNSRPDNTGRYTPATGLIDDDNTDDFSVFIRGAAVRKTGANTRAGNDLPTRATIGDIVRWTITGTVPSGAVAYWPVIEENALPTGFDYVPNSTVVTSATLDTANHLQNPKDDNNIQLRWYLQTIDNTAGATTYTFTLSFDTLVTGVRGGAVNTRYYTNNTALATARNTTYIAWYDNASGYNNSGFADDSFVTANITRRSPKATADITIRQPNLTLSKTSDKTIVGANVDLTYTLQTVNLGYADAYDVVLSDSLPSGITLLSTREMRVVYPAGVSGSPFYTDSNSAGTTALTYTLDALPPGAAFYITYTARVDAAISAGLLLTNSARVAGYTTQRGLVGDNNGDTLADERAYTGPFVKRGVKTPEGGILKTLTKPSETTVGAPLIYKLIVPPNPINATMYNVRITDSVPSSVIVSGVGHGALIGGQVQATFASIPPNTQRVVYITGTVALTATDNLRVTNRATLAYQGRPVVTSNSVVHTVMIPALALAKWPNVPSVGAGDTLTYTVALANVGYGAARSVRLTDALPPNMTYVSGSGLLNGQPLADPTSGAWTLPDISGRMTHTVQFRANVLSAERGVPYTNTVSATAVDVNGAAIPADNRARVPADRDADDTAYARVYGPLDWVDYNAIVAYEDLKQVGWSDWDYNDFVFKLATRRGLDADGNVAAMLLDYEALARGAAYDHNLRHRLPLLGGGQAIVVVRDAAGAQLAQQALPFTSTATFSIFERTRRALMPPQGSLFTNSPVTQTTRITGHTASLMVVLDDPSRNPGALLSRPPWDPYIYVVNTGREVHLMIPGYMNNSQTVNGVHEANNPMIGFDLPLARTFPSAWQWPVEHYGVWRGYPRFVNHVSTGGMEDQDWYLDNYAVPEHVWTRRNALGPDSALAAPASRYFGNVVVSPLDASNTPYIIVGNLVANKVEVYDGAKRAKTGWPKSTGGGVKAAPAVADLNGDGSREIIAGSTNGYLYAWHADGQTVSGFPIRVSVNPSVTYRILATPAVGDIDGDGSPDIVVPLSDGRLYAFGANGAPKWNSSLGDVLDVFSSQMLNSSPVIADLDGDNAPEIVIGAMDNNVYALRGNGSMLWTYMTGDIVQSTPAVADIDSTHAGREVVIGSADGYVYLLDKSGGLIWQRGTGWSVRSSPLVADVNGDGGLDIVVGGEDQYVWIWKSDGELLPGWPKATGAPILSSPRLGDVDQDGVHDIVIGSDDSRVYAWRIDGSAIQGWPRDTTMSVKGAPALANLDGDARLEVVAGDFGGQLYVWGYGANFVTYFPVVGR